MIMGFHAGGFVLVSGLALILFALWKRNRKDKEDDHDDDFDEDLNREQDHLRSFHMMNWLV